MPDSAPSSPARPAPPSAGESTHGPAGTRQQHRGATAFSTLAVGALALIVLGSLVRAHGAGLACPDWPLCLGRVLPIFDLRIAFEWSHRALAGSLALGLAGVTLWIGRRPALLAAIGGLLAICWGLLALQVALGGLTVLLGLAPWTVVAHLLCGNAFCAALFWCSRGLRERTQPAPSLAAPGPGIRALVALVAALLVAQVWLGGMVSSHYAGLACAHFPSCDGVSLAPSLTGPVGLQVAHRMGAVALTAAVVLLAIATRHSGGRIARLARLDLAGVGLQICVGASNVWLELPAEVTALHSLIAATMVLVTSLLVRESLLARSLPSLPYEPSERVQARGGAPA